MSDENRREILQRGLEKARRFIADSKAGKTEPILLYRWLRHDTWTAEEAALLLVGLDPNATRLGTTKAMISEMPLKRIEHTELLDGRELSRSFPVEETEERDELRRLSSSYRDILAVLESGTHPARNPPEYYLKWAKAKGFEVPWLEWAQQNFLLIPNESVSEETASRPLGTRERRNVARIIAVLAQKAGFDLSEPFKAATAIELATERNGHRVSDDTIASWLKAAANELPDEKPKLKS